MLDRKRVLIFTSGTEEMGNADLQDFAEGAVTRVFHGNIVGVVSQYTGGVREQAMRYELPFYHFPGPYTVVDNKKGYPNLPSR